MTKWLQATVLLTADLAETCCSRKTFNCAKETLGCVRVPKAEMAHSACRLTQWTGDAMSMCIHGPEWLKPRCEPMNKPAHDDCALSRFWNTSQKKHSITWLLTNQSHTGSNVVTHCTEHGSMNEQRQWLRHWLTPWCTYRHRVLHVCNGAVELRKMEFRAVRNGKLRKSTRSGVDDRQELVWASCYKPSKFNYRNSTTSKNSHCHQCWPECSQWPRIKSK